MNIVYNEDCVQGMKRYADRYFDLAVVDPPYGINITNQSGFGTLKKDKKWDTETPTNEYFNELFRVSKNQIIWGGNYFLDYLSSTNCCISWDKMNGTNDMADFELAWTSFKSPNRRYNLHHFSKGYDRKIHPTQKPTKLYEWIFRNYIPNGGIVLDTHLGSGSSRIAADETGNIDFVGFEIDKQYFEAQEKRFQNYVAQLRLW